MRYPFCAASVFLILAACSQGQQAGSRPEPTRTIVETEIVEAVDTVVTEDGPGGSLDSFVPAVAAREEGGNCEVIPRTSGGGPLYILSFRDSRSTLRSVSVAFDSAGRPANYSDLRGDLRRERTGPFTAILLSFGFGSAHVVNERPGQPSETAHGALSDALTSDRLGNPQRMIELIRTRCVKP